MTSLIKTPFANFGDKGTVPEEDPSGGVNMTQGYGQAYSLDPNTNPSAKRIERELMNGLFNLITKAIREIQINGITPFITSEDNGGSAFAYDIGATVLYEGAVYQSLKSENTDLPDVLTSWSHLMKVGDFGLGLENSASTGIDFTTYIFRAGEVLKLHIQDCQNVPTQFASESDIYVQCIGVRNQAYGCGLIFSVYNHPEKTYIAQRENNTDGVWHIVQLGNADTFSDYLPLTGGTLTGELYLEDKRIIIDEPDPGAVADGDYVTSEAYCWRLLGRGANADPAGAIAKMYYREHVGITNEVILHIVGFGNDVSFSLDGNGNFSAPGGVYDAGQRVYSPNNPQPINLPQIVQDVQLGGRVFIEHIGDVFQTPAGCVMVSLAGDSDNDISGYYAPIQKNINGSWITIAG